MFINDLFLLFLIYFLCLTIFLILHIIAIRLYDSKSFLTYLMGITLVSVIAATVFSYFFIAKSFINFEAYVLANVGAVLAAVFTCGFYAFIGPVTADRSLAAQVVMFLYHSNKVLFKEDILKKFNTALVLEKRYDECMKAKIIKEQGREIILTDKGRKIARFYLLLIKALNLSGRSQYKDYFS